MKDDAAPRPTPRPQPNGHAPGEHATELLAQMRLGSDGERTDAARRLLEVLYGELRSLAGSLFRGQASSHTLQPTALVHEAWMRLVDSSAAAADDRA